jgi:hypothetical protein
MNILEMLFGGSVGKRIYRKEFEQAIMVLPNISDKEREYLRGVFSNALKDGITEIELKKVILGLQHNVSDSLDAIEVESVKRKLFGELEDNR